MLRHPISPIIALALSLLAPILVHAEPGSGKPQKTPKPYPDGINCIWLPNIASRSYSLIDDQHLVIEATRRKQYLITLSRRCVDLDTTLEIGLTTHGSQLCGPGDSIITDNDRCMIQYVEEVRSYEEAESIVEAREAAEREERPR